MPLPSLALAALIGLAAAEPARAAGDPAAGQRVFNQCRACHTVDEGGRHGVGPNLHGIVDAAAGAREGFRYSPAMRTRAEQGLRWTEDNLRLYLRNPRDLVPGGSMAFAGIRNDRQLEDLIAFLRQN
ncbi:cytochrome c family protein [Elioraea sp. Yellowstone]|jgi:cytochrome c|uniref:c-type cytochrome n=1 Tax=unclassified Elioraea TaxID=2619524 RepID=UPI0011500B96|nr:MULTISPECIES: cytochrome c family protein [unclassified Elioraea]TQF78332.1 cytochrome c family protein [Elioraea sp. Yellowstone]GIX08777.1 MAG: cytochrome c [Elioraea sp.]